MHAFCRTVTTDLGMQLSSVALEGTEIRPMSLLDVQSVLAIWKKTPGIVLREDDSPKGIERYLNRNSQLSFVATQSHDVVGAILGGHDGRRGILQHLAVLPDYRQQGIGAALVQHALIALEQEGIRRVHVDVVLDNPAGHRFWAKHGWIKRTDIVRYSLRLRASEISLCP